MYWIKFSEEENNIFIIVPMELQMNKYLERKVLYIYICFIEYWCGCNMYFDELGIILMFAKTMTHKYSGQIFISC